MTVEIGAIYLLYLGAIVAVLGGIYSYNKQEENFQRNRIMPMGYKRNWREMKLLKEVQDEDQLSRM